MFTKTVKSAIVAVALTAMASATTAVSAQEMERHGHHGMHFNNAAVMGAGFLIGTVIGATLHNPDGSTVTSRYPRVGPRNTHIYEERDPRGIVTKRKVIRKVKKVRKPKKLPVFASSYDPRTNMRTTAYRDANGKRVVLKTRGPVLPPQFR